jgi:hypothetical protein
MDNRLILFYNTMWEAPLEAPEDLPAGCELTVDRRRYADADTVVFHIPEWGKWRRFFLPRKRQGQVWVAWSMECEQNYPLLLDPRFMGCFDLTMSYRLDSDIPVPYARGYEECDFRRPPGVKVSEPLVTSFISSSANRSGRREYVRELAGLLPMDSYGRFLRNRTLTPDQGRRTKLQTISRYKFTLAFENAVGEDYVTEKFYDPLLAGSVPVYLGAPNIEDFAPGDRCFVNAADFPHPGALAEYLSELGNNQEAYRAFFAWKEQPYRPSFRKLMEYSAKHPFVRLCEMDTASVGALQRSRR